MAAIAAGVMEGRVNTICAVALTSTSGTARFGGSGQLESSETTPIFKTRRPTTHSERTDRLLPKTRCQRMNVGKTEPIPDQEELIQYPGQPILATPGPHTFNDRT